MYKTCTGQIIEHGRTRHGQQCGYCGHQGGGRGYGGIHGDGQRLEWGGEHTVQYTDDVL